MGDLPPPPKLPIPGKRNILITSVLPVNNLPHLGNIIGVLSADVFARYCRLRGYNAIYICGTDDYRTAMETKAVEENCNPQEICDKYHEIHKGIYDWFNISFDKFGRTSTPEQTEACQAVFKKLLQNNWLSENTMPEVPGFLIFFCDKCARFLAGQSVEGNCPTPSCGNTSARGDRCEKCGKLLDSSELVEPRCKVCGTTPRIGTTEHLYLDLPLLKEKLEEYIHKMSVAGGWSQNAILATHAWLSEGLKQRCITRDLKWGVPVPHEKFKDKVFCLLFAAPIGYVSITACYTKEWEKWWKNPENVELFQFMGKNDVPFHTVMFPASLLGTGESWTLMKTISVTEYLNYEAGKFSKSKGIGVFGNDVQYTKIPVEVWRYYLLTNRPEVSDTLFTWVDLQAKINSELVSNLGNFINRVLSFIAKDPGTGYGSIIPDVSDAESHPLTKSLGEEVGKKVGEYIEAMEKVKLKQGLKIAMAISSEGNGYLQESQFWRLYKEDLPLCSIVMKTSAGLVYLLACLLEPFMPSFTIEVLKQLNLPPDTKVSLSDEQGDVERARRPWECLPAGHRIGKPAPLFKELTNEEVECFRERFAGSQADTKCKEEEEAKIVEQGSVSHTTLFVCHYANGIFLACDSQSNDITEGEGEEILSVDYEDVIKITELFSRVHALISGDVREAEIVLNQVRRELRARRVKLLGRDIVRIAAERCRDLFKQKKYSGADIFVCGWSRRFRCSIYQVNDWQCEEVPDVSAFGSGGGFLMANDNPAVGSYLNQWHPGMDEKKALSYMTTGMEYAIGRDIYSGGCVRMTRINSKGVERKWKKEPACHSKPFRYQNVSNVDF